MENQTNIVADMPDTSTQSPLPTGFNRKKISIIVLVIIALGGIAYFASTTSLFSGNVFNDFKAKSVEDFFPVEVEDFSKIKLSKTEAGNEIVTMAWKGIISKYLGNKSAFSESKLAELSQGQDLEILAASWNSGKNNLVAVKLGAENLNKLVASKNSADTYYASVLDSGEPRLIAARKGAVTGASPVQPRFIVPDAAAGTGTTAAATGVVVGDTGAAIAGAGATDTTTAGAGAGDAAAGAGTAGAGISEAAIAAAKAEAEAAKAAEEAAKLAEAEAAKAAEEAAKLAEAEATKAAEEAAKLAEAEATKAAEEAAKLAEAEAAKAAEEAAKLDAKLCDPSRNFCIVGDYLLLGNSIEFSSKLINGPVTKKISANADYKKLNEQFKRQKNVLISGKDKIFLATPADIKAYFSGAAKPVAASATDAFTPGLIVLNSIEYGTQEGDILKYKEGGYKDDDQEKGKGILTFNNVYPEYKGTKKVNISTQICNDNKGTKCATSGTREAIPFGYDKYTPGKKGLQSVSKGEIANAVYSLGIPVQIIGKDDANAPKAYVRITFSVDGSTDALCATGQSACTALKEFKVLAEPVFGKNEAAEIEKIAPQIEEIKKQLDEENTKAKTAGQQALDAGVQLATQYSSPKYTAAATAIYAQANIKASAKSNEADEAVTALNKLVISDADFKVMQKALDQAKQYASAAKTADEAMQQLTGATKLLTDAQTKLSGAQKQVSIAEEAALQAKQILLDAEGEVQKLGDAAFKEAKEEKPEAPTYLIDQWDPKDDQIGGATLITLPANAEAGTEYLSDIHQFSPFYNEKTDWFKMDVVAGKKYTFGSNATDKVQISLASNADNAACSASGTKETAESGKLVYKPQNNETICISASTNQSDNLAYSVSYKFTNVVAVPISEGVAPATVVKMTTTAGQDMKIAVEGSSKVDVLSVDFAGIGEKVTIDQLQLAIATTEKAYLLPDIPVKGLFIYDASGTLLAQCTPDEYGLALCSNIGFTIPAGAKSTMVIKADLIPLNTVNDAGKIKSANVFNVAIKSIPTAYKANVADKVTIETRAPLKCTAKFISYNSLSDVTDDDFSPKCGNEIMPGDIIFADKKEYILIADKKSTETNETMLFMRKQYGSSAFFGNTTFATNSEKLLVHGGLIMFRASKPVITTEIYPDDKKISKNLAKGVYQFKLKAEKNAFSMGRIVFEVQGELGGIKIGPATNSSTTYVVDKDHHINFKDVNGLTVAGIEKLDLAYAGEDGAKLPVEFKYYYDKTAKRGYIFADMLEDVKVDTKEIKLELKAKITGDLVGGDYLTINIPAVLDSSQLINNDDIAVIAQKAAYRKSMAKSVNMTKRTLFPDFVDPNLYAVMDDTEKAKLITKFFLFDDFVWSDRDKELRLLDNNQKKFNFDMADNFIGGYMLESLPTEEQTLYY